MTFISKLLKLIVHILTKTIKITHASIYLRDGKNNRFILKAYRGNVKTKKTVKYINGTHPIIQLFYRVRDPIFIEDIKSSADQRFGLREAERKEVLLLSQELDSTLMISFIVEDVLLGFLVLGEKVSGQAYTDDDLNVLAILANQSALAIENALFYEEAKVAEVERIQSEKFATIGRLATSAKHEINNPLAMISMGLQSMTMALKESDNDFLKVRERLSDTIKNVTAEIDEIKKETISDEITAELDTAASIFNNIFVILDKKGLASSTAAKEITEYCSVIKGRRDSLEKISENIGDEEKKERIENIIHQYEVIAKNAFKIINMQEVFNGYIKTAAENVKRIEMQTQTMHDLPTKLDKDLTAIDIDALIEAAFGFARQQTYWENLGATPVEKILPENCPKVRGYFNRLVVVFLNLIINAYQAMTDAGLRSSYDRLIRISVNVDVNDPAYIEIHFANKGPLIPTSVIERIFERGYTTKKSGSSGLGLHISRIQVELNSGTMHAKNVEGFGPDFIVRLPIWKEGGASEKAKTANS